MRKSMFWVGIVFAAIGALLLTLAGIAFVSDRMHSSDAKRAEGTVIALRASNSGNNGTTYAPIVNWTDANGITHRHVSNTGSSNPFSPGEKVTILYDPDRPDQAVIDSFGQRFTGMLISGGIGLVFLPIGALLIYLYLRRRWIIARLKQSGEQIEAKFIRCDVDIGTVVNGRNPYRVHAQGKHPKTGRLASFKSDPIWLDLSDTLQGKTVPVLVDRRRYRDHYILLDEWVIDEERA